MWAKKAVCHGQYTKFSGYLQDFDYIFGLCGSLEIFRRGVGGLLEWWLDTLWRREIRIRLHSFKASSLLLNGSATKLVNLTIIYWTENVKRNLINLILESSKPEGGFKAWSIVVISFLIFMIEVTNKMTNLTLIDFWILKGWDCLFIWSTSSLIISIFWFKQSIHYDDFLTAEFYDTGVTKQLF